MGCLIEKVGFQEFVSALGRTADAAFIDTRVLFCHLGLVLPAKDRFSSDLMRPEGVEDPIAREFTRCALESEVPIVLGGHCLVSGGLRALADAAAALREFGDNFNRREGFGVSK